MSEVYVCQLPVEIQKYAEEVLHETEETRQSGFEEIKKWAEENSHLHVRTEEKYILPFLRCSKFDVDKTKKRMENFYILRRDRTEWYKNRNPFLPVIQQLVKMGCFLVLRKTHENLLVVIIRPTLHNPSIYSLDDILKTAQMILDIAIMEEELGQVYGVIAIIDMTNVSAGHARQLSISRIKHLVHAWQNYHCRPKKIQFVNAPSYINVVLNVFKSFMSEKLRKRVHVSFQGNSALASVVSTDILPKNYGGEGETIEDLGNYWLEKLKAYADWFAEDEQYVAE